MAAVTMAKDAAPPAPPSDAAAAATAAAAAPSFSDLLSFSDSTFFVLDLAGVILYASPTCATLFAAPPEQLLGRHVRDQVEREERAHLAAMLRAVRAAAPGAPPATAHLRALRGAAAAGASPGERAWTWAEFKLSSDGEYLYLVARDVTSEKRVEETLRSFLLTTSHDLRTPCHGMKCASQLLLERPGVAADTEARYLLRVLRASCRLMLATIGNVLDLKALEAECATGHVRQLRARNPIRIHPLLADVLDVCRIGCSAEITWLDEQRAAEAVPPLLEGDFSRVRQVLQNVAVVCAGYADASPVTVELTREAPTPDEDATGAVRLLLRFTLSGRALSPAEAGAAFDPFADSEALALRVAQSLARAADGDVCLVCGGDAGDRIDVRMRLYAPGAPPAPPDGPTSPAAEERADAAGGDASMPPAVELTERMFHFLMTHSDSLFSTGVLLDSGPMLTFVSGSMNKHWFGYTTADFLGQSPAQWCHPDDMPLYAAALSDALALSAAAGGGPAPFAVTRRFRKPDGSWVPVHTSGSIEGDR